MLTWFVCVYISVITRFVHMEQKWTKNELVSFFLQSNHQIVKIPHTAKLSKHYWDMMWVHVFFIG